MCGRQACTLDPTHVPKACRYRDSNGHIQQPKWRNNSSGNYQPSYNIGPHTQTPVLLSSKQLGLDVSDHGERVICAMKWGLVPSWSKDGGKGFNTINCRVETMNEKVTYKQPLNKGRRCVILADGFFEWHTQNGKKQPYFLYFKDNVRQNNEALDEHDTPNCQLLTMAGLFEEAKGETEDTPYTYTVITVSSSKSLQWLHDRMPAILETDDEIRDWLESGSVPVKTAVSLLKPKDCLQWYPVSTVVNNVRNKSIECVKKVELSSTDDQKKVKTKGFMDSWVKKSPRKNPNREKIKIEGDDITSVQLCTKMETVEQLESEKGLITLKRENNDKSSTKTEPDTKKIKVEGNS